jgi:hypothetical protein
MMPEKVPRLRGRQVARPGRQSVMPLWQLVPQHPIEKHEGVTLPIIQDLAGTQFGLFNGVR